jgi:hypothetical protein
MNALSSIEVEPLGDQRWLKIERSLMARVERVFDDADDFPEPRARSWTSAILVAAALVSGLGITLFVAREQPQHAALEAPSRIATGPNSSHLALPGLALDVGPHSAVVVGGETSEGLLIVLDRGSIVCEVAPRAQDRPVMVQAGGARVRVIGTRFSVIRLGETARVNVEHGVVEVLSSGGKWRVGAGQEWPPAPASSAPVEGPSVASSDSGSEVRHLQAGSRATPAEAPHERIVSRPRTSATPAAVEGEVTAVREAAPKPGPSRQEVFEQGTALERGDPARAAQLYSTLESGGDSWAQNALYAHGRLEAARGSSAAARRLLTSYLERFPQGINAEDARAVLQRLR